jgi:hypothetical protein
MSDSEKLREEILSIVAAAGEPISAPAILQEAKHADDREQFSQTLFYMSKTGELKKHPAPEGSGAGVRFLYGIGDGKPRAAASGGDPKAEVRRQKADRKAPKPRRAKHAKRRRAVRGNTSRQPSAARRQQTPNDRSPAAVWALRSDGAFILMGEDLGMVLPREQARALVEFIRRLDKAEV